MSRKGKYVLVEDFFPEEFRSKLPVNLFLLRSEKTPDLLGYSHSRSFVKSKTYNTDNLLVGYYYKSI